jgi:hypothetical protein
MEFRKLPFLKLLAILTLWGVVASVFLFALTGDWQKVWQHLNVPGIPYHSIGFEDLWTIPQSVERVQRGIDPFIDTGVDIHQLPMGYPRIWISIFSLLHITMDRVAYFGLFLVALYLSCISWMIAKAKSKAGILLLLLATFSGSSLLAMERGNNDLLIFALMYPAAESAILQLFFILLALAAILKFYPMVALMAGLINKGWRLAIAVTVLGLLLFFYSEREDLPKIAHNIPPQIGIQYTPEHVPVVNSETYGAKSIGYILAAREPASLSPYIGEAGIMAACYLASLLLAGAGIIFGFRSGNLEANPQKTPLLALCCAFIFLATYFAK